MPRTKREKWTSNLDLERVHEPSVSAAVHGHSELRGQWHTDVFGNDRPITLELGCGKGEYTLELARQRLEAAREATSVLVKEKGLLNKQASSLQTRGGVGTRM